MEGLYIGLYGCCGMQQNITRDNQKYKLSLIWSPGHLGVGDEGMDKPE